MSKKFVVLPQTVNFNLEYSKYRLKTFQLNIKFSEGLNSNF